MKRLLAFCFLLAWACGCAAQAPTVYVDNLTGTNIIVTGTGCTNTILSCSIATSNGTLYSTWSPGMVFLFGDPQSINLDTTGLVLGPQAIFKTFLYQGTIRLSPADGAFHITPDVHFDNVIYGDGSGLTNIMGTNIVGAVAESSHATNADIAVSASNATNLWGQITTTNLPPGVLTNNWNGPTVVITNSSLVVTGAQYFAVSNGASRFLVTNGSFIATLRSSVRSTLDVWGALGLNNSSGASRAVIRASDEDGRINVSNGNEDSSPNFIFGPRGSPGGANANVGSQTNWPGFSVAGATNNPTLRLQAGNATNMPASLIVSGGLFVTNGIYYSATSNGVVSTNVIQPLHTFAALMGFVTNTINGGANTYAIVTNYSTARTNLMSCSLTAGTITNTIAGYYYVAIHMSMVSLDAGALVEGDLLLNSVERDEVSFQTQFDPGTPRYKGASAFGILYIPANTQITFQIKSSGASGIQLRRQQLVVMPP